MHNNDDAARDAALVDGQIWENLPEPARDHYRRVADEYLTPVEAPPMRYALVAAREASDTERIAAYLPANYRVLGRTPMRATNNVQILIGGSDVAGWTLDDYVIPRLASGLIFAEEIA